MHATVSIKEEEFWLLPERAMWWPAQKMLVIADVHFGKTSHFRKNGVALLSELPYRELENLNKTVKRYQPEKLVFLGDLFHSDVNREWGLFTDWLQHLPCQSILVNGNHDAALLQNAALGKMKSVENLEIGDFTFTHEPLEKPGEKYNFCGHIHPGFVLKGKASQRLRLPCFSIGLKQAILPAFGLTTGFVAQKPNAKTKFFVVAEDDVVEVSASKK